MQPFEATERSRTERTPQRAEAIASLLAELKGLHDHLCPRQVLGVRMGMLASELLGLALPQKNKQLLTFVETDGCFSDGVAVATGCWMGHRTMRLVDHGKVAATFVDTSTGAAWRIAPHPMVRSRAALHAPDKKSRWSTMLIGYQRMAIEELLVWQPVSLCLSLEAIVSNPGLRTLCNRCGEEIVNRREIEADGEILCRACSGDVYLEGWKSTASFQRPEPES